jgi:hypothetical protein
MNEKSPFSLPHLEEIFQLLCRGRHVCAEDGSIYFALHDNAAAFEDLFTHLGFKMEVHSRDFYYFRGGKSLSNRSERMALFIFILMEHLDGQGEAVEEGILTKTFSISELPHLGSKRYRSYMKEIGIADDEGLSGIVANLEKFGFAQRKGDTFRFRSPVYRFFDICGAIVQEANQSTVHEKEQIL